MKRSRAFILSEQLMTIMLQAGFILVLCTSFYQLISFYTRTQQVLTARNHAERVISFMDEKIRNAGLGLWQCKSSSDIRRKLGNVTMLCTDGDKGYRLPIALQNGFRYKDNPNEEKTPQDAISSGYLPLLSLNQDKGNIITLLYAQKELSTGDDYELISAFKKATTLVADFSSGTDDTTGYTVSGTLALLDVSDKNRNSLTEKSVPFKFGLDSYNIKSYTVMEGLGVPLYLFTSSPLPTNGSIIVEVFGVPSVDKIIVPAAGELLSLNCMQMFVHGTDGTEEGRQFAFRELTNTGGGWDKTYNQEKGILDIYMELDKEHSVLTLWVLASGGYDASLNNPRPETWPDNANPRLSKYDASGIQTANDAKTAWLSSTYCHHIVYVSRASWKLNNIPPNFGW